MTSNTSANDVPLTAGVSGRVVSKGRAEGYVFVLPKVDQDAHVRDLTDDEKAAELTRFDRAIAIATGELKDAEDKYLSSVSGNAREIISAQIALLNDPSFNSKVRSLIKDHHKPVQLAIRLVTDEYRELFLSLDDEHLREKAADLQDVCDRLLSALRDSPSAFEVPKNAVIVCSEIWPSIILTLSASEPAAIISETGGWTSHAFILARELGIPAISGVKNATQRFSTGDLVVVDAVKGSIYRRTSPIERNETSSDSSHCAVISDEQLDHKVKLSDGTELELVANVDSPGKCAEAFAAGVSAIGLVRSEYLFKFDGRLPDESSQIQKYRAIADAADGRPVAIRTFDVGLGQILSVDSKRERNPALGMRSIRLTLKYERQFRMQLRSLVRSNTSGNLSLVIPMVSGSAEVRRVRALLFDEFESARNAEPEVQLPTLGAMIELPSAVLTIDQILDDADFVCIGTNDLVQYTLGVDRDNESVADWYQTLHPAILRSISSVVAACSSSRKDITLCGEMAASPFYLPLLVGLGIRRLSMNPASIRTMLDRAKAIDAPSCRHLAERSLEMRSSSEIELALAKFCSELWPDVAGQSINFPLIAS